MRFIGGRFREICTAFPFLECAAHDLSIIAELNLLEFRNGRIVRLSHLTPYVPSPD
jgi:hypothetical protein